MEDLTLPVCTPPSLPLPTHTQMSAALTGDISSPLSHTTPPTTAPTTPTAIAVAAHAAAAIVTTTDDGAVLLIARLRALGSSLAASAACRVFFPLGGGGGDNGGRGNGGGGGGGGPSSAELRAAVAVAERTATTPPEVLADSVERLLAEAGAFRYLTGCCLGLVDYIVYQRLTSVGGAGAGGPPPPPPLQSLAPHSRDAARVRVRRWARLMEAPLLTHGGAGATAAGEAVVDGCGGGGGGGRWVCGVFGDGVGTAYPAKGAVVSAVRAAGERFVAAWGPEMVAAVAAPAVVAATPETTPASTPEVAPEAAPEAPAAPATTRAIRVVAYNTQSSASLQRYKDDHAYVSWSDAAAAERVGSLMEQVACFRADVVALSEVDRDDYRQRWRSKEAGGFYHRCALREARGDAATPGASAAAASAGSPFFEEHVEKDRHKQGSDPDGLLFYLRRDTVPLLNSFPAAGAAANGHHRQSGGASVIRYDEFRPLAKAFGVPLPPDPTRNVGAVFLCSTAAAAPGGGGLRRRRLAVASTHLYWKPTFEGWKLFQALALKGFVTMQGGGWGEGGWGGGGGDEDACPTVVAGDFNALPGSLVHAAMLDAECEAVRAATRGYRLKAPLHGAAAAAAAAETLQEHLELCGRIGFGVHNVVLRFAVRPSADALRAARFDVTLRVGGGETVALKGVSLEEEGTDKVKAVGGGGGGGYVVSPASLLAQGRRVLLSGRSVRAAAARRGGGVWAEATVAEEGGRALEVAGLELCVGPAGSPRLRSAYGGYAEQQGLPVELATRPVEPVVPERKGAEEPAFTTFAPKKENPFAGTIDYVFHTDHLRCEAVARLPGFAEVRKGMPNATNAPSDHAPLCADLVFV